MISRKHFISQGPYFKNLKHEKEHTKNFRSKYISFMITLLYTGILDYRGLYFWH